MAAQTTGQLIDRLHLLREDKRDLNRQLKEIDAEYSELQTDIIAALDRENIDQGRGQAASASISEADVPVAEDWVKIRRWINKNNRSDMLENRISVSAWREEMDLRKGRPLPGVGSFTKRTLNLRAR